MRSVHINLDNTSVNHKLANVTCYAIWGLLDKDDDLRASYELLNTEIIVYIFQVGAEI